MPATKTPNLYHLHGKDLEVSYTTTTIAGQPALTVQDSQGLQSFGHNEIRVVPCDLGTLVSITLRTTADAGSTSLSLFIPEVRILGESAPVETYGVTTTHHVGTRLHPRFGQYDTYSVTVVQGTAEFVRS